MVSFIFGGENMPKTPQELARLRQMAEALSPSRRVPQNVGEGLSAIGQAIASRIIAGRADRAERAGVDAANSAFAGLFTPSVTADTNVDTTTTPSSVVDTSQPSTSTVETQKTAETPSMPGTMENARRIDRAATPDYSSDMRGFLKVIDAGKGWTQVEGPNGTVKRIGARNWRNNNPGNIEYGDFAKKLGAIGTDGRFAVFPTYEQGRKAKESLLFENPNYKDKTIAAAISRYAPPSENNTNAYISSVANAVGVSSDTPLSALTPQQRIAMMDAMQKVEGFRPGREVPLTASALQDSSADTQLEAFKAQPNLDAKMVPAPVPVVDVPEGFQQPDPLETQAKPVDVADNSNYFPPAPVKETRKKVVEALTRKPATSDFDVMKAIEVMNNPFLDDGKKAVAAALIKRKFEEQDAIAAEQRRLADPKYQMDLEKGRLELDALKNPKKARTLSDAEEKALGLDTSGIYQEMPDGSLKTVRDPSKPIDALNAEKAQIEVNNLKNPPKLAELSADDKKALGLPLDGVYQRKPDGSIITVREPEKATADWSKLDDGRLFNQRTGEIKDVAGQTVGFRFPGNSPEAAALNGLIDNGTLTEKQAMDIAAGKQLTGPNGEIIFATPQALIGAQPQVTEPQVRDDGGIDIFAGQTPDVPVDPKKPTTATDKPVDAVPVMEQPNSGMVPLTAPKVTVDERKAAGFADRMAQSGKILDSLEDFAANPDTKWDQVKNSIPFGVGNLLTSEDFKKFDQAKRDFVNAQLRRESGAVISDSEFANAEQQYFPQPGDPPDVIKQKRDLRKKVVESMMRDAGPTYKPPVIEDAKPETKDDTPPADLPDDMKELWKFMTPEERKLWQN